MAVVQISRIQIRRGKATSGTGVPQLASGELGWAVDTQKMYIGNGSVAEGAPEVGNTEILTQHTDIFAFAEQYQYKKGTSYITTGLADNSPIKLFLQDRLDLEVYVDSFGVKGDGTTDDTVAIQRAINELFLNTNKFSEESRVTLHFGPGIYKISNTLKIPPFASLKGAGENKTVISQTADLPIFTNVTSASEFDISGNMVFDTSTLFENSILKQTRNVTLEGMTVEFSSTNLNNAPITYYKNAFDFTSLKDSTFKNLKVIGRWGTASNYTIQANNAAFNLKSIQSSSYPLENNIFENIKIENFSHAIYSSYDIKNNTFEKLDIFNCGYGVMLGKDMPAVTQINLADKIAEGQAYGPENTVIKFSKFDDIYKQGFYVEKGTGNESLENFYDKVGNDGGTSITAVVSVIRFDSEGNISTNDKFTRTVDLSYGTDFVAVDDNPANYPNYNLDTIAYIPEIEGSFISTNKITHRVPVTYTPNNELTCFRLPGNQSRSFIIDYTHTVGQNFKRTGTLTVLVNRSSDTVSVTDDYEAIGDLSTYGQAITFSGELVDVAGASDVDTVYIECYNTINSDATLTFRIDSKS